jgi:hypothetical protein
MFQCKLPDNMDSAAEGREAFDRRKESGSEQDILIMVDEKGGTRSYNRLTMSRRGFCLGSGKDIDGDFEPADLIEVKKAEMIRTAAGIVAE